MSKIVLMHEFGGPEVLKLEELPTPEPAPGEVRLKVEAIGLNRADVMYRSGNYPLEPRFPSKNGYEAAGVIDAIGSDVTGFAIGDRVASIPAMFQLNEYGVYGNTAIVPARAVAHYPENLTPEIIEAIADRVAEKLSNDVIKRVVSEVLSQMEEKR